MIQQFFKSILLEVIGVFTKWVVNLLTSAITRKKPKSFSEIWNGKKRMSDPDMILHGLSNTLLGFLVLIIIFFCLARSCR